jgi:putative acetyltransferase
VSAAVSLRPYETHDADACHALWLRAWQAAYPDLNFAARLDWWRDRWREELVPFAKIVVAEREGAAIGFVTIDPKSLYLDQLVVAPDSWGGGIGAALIAEAKIISPYGIDLDVNTDNARAIRFYEKCGFAITGAGTNPISGKPIHRMSWRGN